MLLRAVATVPSPHESDARRRPASDGESNWPIKPVEQGSEPEVGEGDADERRLRSAALRALIERVRSQQVGNIGRWTRDELYDS